MAPDKTVCARYQKTEHELNRIAVWAPASVTISSKQRKRL